MDDEAIRVERESASGRTGRLAAREQDAVGRLSGEIAHGFNNVLQPIVGLAEFLAGRFRDDADALKALAEIRRSAARGAFLTRQLLTFSRRQVVCRRPEAVHGIVEDVCASLREELGEEVRLFVELGARAPMAMVDRAQIGQLLTNLVICARATMPSGGTITVRTRRTGPDGEPTASDVAQLCLEVHDDGSGCAGVWKEAGSGTVSDFDSVGDRSLARGVVESIVDDHDGVFRFESIPTGGTVARVYLPLLIEEEKAAPVFPSAPTDPATGGALTNRDGVAQVVEGKILLVEDEPAVLRFISLALTQAGYSVIEATGCRAGLEAFAREGSSIALVFSDAVLPDGNGVDLIDHLMAENPGIRALLSSGYTDKEHLVSVAGARGIRFLQKPYPLPTLLETVRAVLEGEPAPALA